jgi:hypothetical protein
MTGIHSSAWALAIANRSMRPFAENHLSTGFGTYQRIQNISTVAGSFPLPEHNDFGMRILAQSGLLISYPTAPPLHLGVLFSFYLPSLI